MSKAILALAFSASLWAAEYKGTITDEKCSKIASMKGDADCAAKCIKGGEAAVLLTADGKVYKIADQAKVTAMAGKLKGDTITVASVK